MTELFIYFFFTGTPYVCYVPNEYIGYDIVVRLPLPTTAF